jgi:hypothetical protein
MQYDMTVAIELPQRPSRPFATTATPGGPLRRRRPRVHVSRQFPSSDWETPLERFDRLHREHRPPLGF